MVPDDLTDGEINFLRDVYAELPGRFLRARAADLLWLRGLPRERATFARLAIEEWTTFPLDDATWLFDSRSAWRRAVDLSQRLGATTADLRDDIRQRLTDRALGLFQGVLLTDLAELLLQLPSTNTDAAETMVKHLSASANEASSESARRIVIRLARKWAHRVRDHGATHELLRQEVESWVREAEHYSAGTDKSALRAASAYESALQTYRQIPARARTSLGIAELGDELQRKIKEAGAAGLDEMGRLRSGSIDLTQAAKDSIDSVSGLEATDALVEFSRLWGSVSFDEERRNAEELVTKQPISSLLSNVHFASDGRVVQKGTPDTEVYGIPGPVWRQMVIAYGIRVSLFVQGGLLPALQTVTNEHRLNLQDFELIAAESSIAPRDRVGLLARGLTHGYNYDFASAIHVLAPQLEHLVRVHLQAAGKTTSTIGPSGVENENGLSSLMLSDDVADVLGEDLTFEIRVLFCDPSGPNLRNRVAHGLLNDQEAQAAEVIYSWWFMLRLLYIPFWNKIRQPRDEQETGEVD